ncbi:carboxypeptidase regulatory-like domain-containing protein [Stieleria marina]
MDKAKLGAASTLIRGIVVDEQGNPVAGAIVQGNGRTAVQMLRVSANAKGAFVHRVKAVGHYGVPMTVRSPSGELSSFISGYDYELSDAKPFKIVLRKARMTTVRVVDEQDRPVEGAALQLVSQFVNLANATTDQSGEAELSFPADAKVDWIVATKSKQGFDYYENYDAFPSQERLDVPDNVQLRLNGAVSVSVTTLDSAKKPIEGVTVTPWSIKKKGKLSYVNLSGSSEWKTDATGVCRFDWIPNDVERGITFLGRSTEYFTPGNPQFDPSAPGNTDLEMDMLQMCWITGTVTYPDGTPAAGVRLQGEGRGDTNHYFRGHTSTKEDGTYELGIYPDQDTMICVVEDDLAAAAVTDILLPEGKRLDDVDFELITGTLVTGLITSGKDKEPVEGQTATLIQAGENRASLVRWSTADSEGRYRFRVGPGQYTLSLAGSPKKQVVVEDENELLFDKHLDRLPRGILRGMITDSDGNSVADALVIGESTNARGHAGFSTRTDATGLFKSERWNDDMGLFAMAEKRGLVGYTRVSLDQKRADLVLVPAASVVGTVVDAQNQPIENAWVSLSSRPPRGEIGPSANRQMRTDDKGQFQFKGLPIEASHTIRVIDSVNEIHESREFKTKDAAEVTLKPIVFGGE